MSWRSRLALVFLTSLVAAGLWVSAQVPPQAPVVISGSDIGFRVEGRRGNVPIGRLVVRVDGQWVEPESTGGVFKLSSK